VPAAQSCYEAREWSDELAAAAGERSALNSCRRAFLAIALFSGMSNILMLTGALFMLEIYDRVLPSRSVPTLVALLILAAGLYAAQGIIDDPQPHPGARRAQPRRGDEPARL
jgi:ABC-type protease/lipase transport system fused ATPase/permease subunit